MHTRNYINYEDMNSQYCMGDYSVYLHPLLKLWETYGRRELSLKELMTIDKIIHIYVSYIYTVY